MSDIYAGTFNKNIPGLQFIDRSAEGFLDITYGFGLDPNPARLYDCGPYTLTITKNGAPFFTVDRPNHFYESSWWIDLVPVTSTDIKNDPAALIATNLVPPFGKTTIPITLPDPGSLTFPGPMQLTPTTTGYEPTTGGRGGIGIVRDSTAEFLITGDARNMLECAKSTATQPIWDYDNGKPIDLIVKPKTTHYSTQAQGGAPDWLGPFPISPADIRPLPNPMPPTNPSAPQTAHMEEICGVVALATVSPRYLRALQMRVVRGFDEDNYSVGQFGAATIFNREMRGTAWLARQLFYCYWATKQAEDAGKLPADCLPSTTFKKLIDNQAAQFTKFIEPQDFFKVFGVWGGSNNAWWQCDMVTQVLCLYAGKWPAVWGPILIKTFKNLAARVNADGKNQWPVASPCWYWGQLGDDASSGHVVPYSGFPELWSKWSVGQATGTDVSGNNGWLTAAQVDALNKDPTNGLVFASPSEYNSWAWGALAYVVYLDRGVLAGAVSAVYPNLEQAYAQQTAMMEKYGYLIPQCSISVTPQPIHTIPAPPVVPPVVPPVNPPTGGIHMSDTAFTLAPDQTKQLDLLDDAGNPVILSGTPTYEQSSPDTFSLQPNAGGVSAIWHKAGVSKITVHGIGANGPMSASSVGTASAPLSASLNLVPRAG